MLKASGCEFMLLTLLVHFKTIKYSCFVHLTLVSTSHKCVLDAGWLSKQSECSSCWHIDNNRNIPVKDYSAEQISRKFLTIWRVIFFYVYKLGYAENEFNILATFHLEIHVCNARIQTITGYNHIKWHVVSIFYVFLHTLA